MEMMTSVSSRYSCSSSYSIFTSHLPTFSDGQQLTGEEGGREGGRERGRERGREGKREGERREGGREGGREEGREGDQIWTSRNSFI